MVFKTQKIDHFTTDNESENLQKSANFTTFWPIKTGQKPLSIGEYLKNNTTCCGDKKKLEKKLRQRYSLRKKKIFARNARR
jgi:hypothetical protein